jgi:hypothetical protein
MLPGTHIGFTGCITRVLCCLKCIMLLRTNNIEHLRQLKTRVMQPVNPILVPGNVTRPLPDTTETLKMTTSNTCKTCHQVEANIDIIEQLKEIFKSKKNSETFEKSVLEIEIAKEIKQVSFNNLKSRFSTDYPKWKENLVSVPSSSLLTYMKKISYFVTEDDVRKYLNGEFIDALKNKREELNSEEIKNVIENMFKRFRKGKMTLMEASELLNDNILDIIFIGENSLNVYKKCENKLKCPNKKCPVKKGFKKKLDVA